MIKKAKGFIIRSQEFRESSLILTVLTEEFGKLSFIAKGARKLDSGFGAALDLLTLSELVFYDGKGLKLLKDATIIQSFWGLKGDYDSVDLGLRCAKLLDELVREGQPDRRIFWLFFDLLGELEGKKDIKSLEIGFLVKLLAALGFTPQLNKCTLCGKTLSRGGKVWFSAERGGIVCSSCSYNCEEAIKLNRGVIKTLKVMLKFPLAKLERLTLSEEIFSLSEKVIKDLFAYHL
jgi:DNA repair protein RecO (recombination protein O)